MSAHPYITRTAVTRRCEACDGTGEIPLDSLNAYGRDPNDDTENPECEACQGEGDIVEWLDPLLVLARRRRWARLPIRGALAYGTALSVAMSPVHLAGCEFLAQCQRVTDDARQTREMLAQACAA